MANSREQIVKNYLRTKLHVKGTDTPVYRLLDILATPDGDVSEIVNRYSALENKALRKSFHDVATLLRSLEKGSSVTAGTKTLRLDTPIIETPTCDISSLPKIKIFVDGCSKGNPGPCGAAFVMKDMEDTTVFEGNRYLGEERTTGRSIRR